ncbi:MAG TPA: amylo-alpha-1,6-glucosidase [Polyangiaceae bacterium]|nr:amylo-alpha-1,6-glucosidase [Polyangiaceae bacterium]
MFSIAESDEAAALQREWLETDGLGGYASGTAAGVRTRRYHALLLAAAHPPAERFVLVNGFVAWLETAQGTVELWPQLYAGGYRAPSAPLAAFENQPWPRWRMSTPSGAELEHELFIPSGHQVVALAFRLTQPVPGARLHVRPLLSGRDFHALHHENASFDARAARHGAAWVWSPYPGVPSVASLSNGSYRSDPLWYHRFEYVEERARGLDSQEDLMSPGVLSWDLQDEAVWLLEACSQTPVALASGEVHSLMASWRACERERRARFSDPLERAVQAYRARRGTGETLLAGFPWFGDWGRDTFIALRGACLATGDIGGARSVVCEWAGTVSQGMLPNRFSERASEAPEYNAVDASLWYVLVADELCGDPRAADVLTPSDRTRIEAAILAIVAGYAAGTRYGIHADADGLLASGEPGVQLTWMDAKVGSHVVTPRSGKAVEVQALWIHALSAAARRDPSFAAAAEAARESLQRRFWNPERQMLFDVIDVGHLVGAVDVACRPNQIFAAGGLPMTLLSSERARAVVDAVERELWTPLGLRTLEQGHPEYRGRYCGGPAERDAAYHQGTVWPWLMGAFIEAWVKSRGSSAAARTQARARFVQPLLEHLDTAGLGHISEVADGSPPHTPRGCPFQAWSVSELLRVVRCVV